MASTARRCALITAFKADSFMSTASILAFTSDCGFSSWGCWSWWGVGQLVATEAT